MKVGTDGVLLGAWAQSLKDEFICDIGCGTGFIALMQTQKNEKAIVYGLEIEGAAAIEAKHNFAESPWKERLELRCVNFLDFACTQQFDHFISNPPFYLSGQNAQSSQRTLARHIDRLSIEKLLHKTKQLGSKKHKISLILPANQLEAVKKTADSLAYSFSRICLVKPNQTKPVHRVLLELSNQKENLVETELTIETSRHVYTPEYVALCSSFYIGM